MTISGIYVGRERLDELEGLLIAEVPAEIPDGFFVVSIEFGEGTSPADLGPESFNECVVMLTSEDEKSIRFEKCPSQDSGEDWESEYRKYEEEGWVVLGAGMCRYFSTWEEYNETHDIQ